MPQNSWSSAAHRGSTPDVPRPDLAIWQPLESERVRWEGQVLIVGQESDLPALLVITGKRLALIAGGEIALEFPLSWMRPEPRLMTENGIRLYLSPNGDDQVSQPMLLRAKAGRGAAVEIAAVLTGRTFSSRDTNSPMHIPSWNDRVGAAPSVALPNLNSASVSSTPAPKPAWPPAETTGVTAARPKPSAEIAPWRTGTSAVPKPQPVPSDTSRAARLLGTVSDGYTVADSVQRSGVQPAVQSEPKRRLPLWILNIAVLALLVAGFGYVAIERGYGRDDLRALVPGNIAALVGLAPTETPVDVAQVPEAVTPEPTEIDAGGDNTLLSVKDTTVKPTAAATEAATKIAVISGDPMDSIGGPSNLPVTASLATPPATDEATETPTETATEAATEAATEVATEAATEEATVAPTDEATAEPTTPATIDPTVPQTPETPVPTAAPTQTVTLEQPASVADGAVPNQQFQQGAMRYSIDAVATGAGIDELPEINNVGQTWVIVTLTAANTGTGDAEFSMANFSLLADGNPIVLDTGTAWVNSLLGNDPAYGNTDSATYAPGEQHQFTLTFLAPANVSNLVLVAGDQQIQLDASVTTSVGLREVSTDTAPAATLTGTVVEVIDGQTIVVDVDGEQITVRYLGIEAPTADACYAVAATAANADLVEGKTVTLERQSVDTNARGLWVRDVWVTNDAGEQVLVGQALVSEGAATVKVSEPNSRYADWLTATQQEAEANAAGLWGSCGN